VPYDRIQNIDAVQNVLHRMLNVVEVRIQTGGGSEPEATLSVLAIDDLEEMRRRVFGSAAAAARASAEAGSEAAVDGAQPLAPVARTLVHLPPRELALYGIIENRGLFVIAAAVGLAWELAQMPNLVGRFFDEEAGQSLFRYIARIFMGSGPTARAVVFGVIGLVLFLLISRVFSIVWAFIRLYGFTVVQTGDDLRTEYGLLTRVVQTIPRRRIQTVTVRQTPLHRWLKRASVRVSTAGGSEEERSSLRREWFAPVLHEAEVEPLLAVLLPGVTLGQLDWRGVHPRAFGRVLRRSLIGTAIYQAIALAAFGMAGFWLLPLLLAWVVYASRLYVMRLGWSTTRDVVAFRTGTLVYATTVAPLVRIQAVAVHESPFDRRTGMARVRVDTAGADVGRYAVNVPYLPRDEADRLHAKLGAAAATTAFQW
jgi:putative membrane protein